MPIPFSAASDWLFGRNLTYGNAGDVCLPRMPFVEVALDANVQLVTWLVRTPSSEQDWYPFLCH